jgi:hypothetical protein
MALGLPPELNRQLQDTLLACAPFGNAAELQAVFADGRIASWRHRLPEATSAAGRVAATVDFLHRRQNDQGESALCLFLRVLAERTPTGDNCHGQLLALAEKVAATNTQEPGKTASPPPARAAGGTKEIPIELREKMVAGEVVVFAGHTVSAAAGLPSRAELVSKLAARLGEEVPPELANNGQALPDIAQLYEGARGRHALLTFMRDALDTTQVQPAGVHQMIARLPVDQIFTTTYDDLLEQTLRGAGRRMNKVVADSMLPHTGGNRIQLLELKGDVELPETVVVTRRDLERYPASHPLIVNQLRDRLSSMTFLLLGYRGDDADLNLLFEQSGYQAGSGRLHYAVMAGISPLQQQLLRSRRIQVLQVAPDALPGWLESLAAPT